MTNIPYLKQSEQGQILVGFLLILVLGITVTLSLITRTTSDLRTTTTTEQSTRAYNAAEAGIEEALKKVESGEIVPAPTPVSGTGSTGTSPVQTTFNYTVTNVGSSTKAFILPEPLLADQYAQVWLADSQTLTPGYTSSRIRVYWGDQGTSSSSATTPGVQVILVYKNKSTGVFGSQEWFYRPSGSTSPSGFNPSSEVGIGTVSVSAAQNNLGTDQTMAFTINEGGSEGLNIGKINLTTNDPILLRLRLLYNNDKGHIAAVMPIDTSSTSLLPAQGYQVDSTGLAPSGASRRIQVFRSYPALAAIFDFALFSGSKEKALTK